MPDYTIDTWSALPRFWSKVDVRGPDDCWMWTAYVHPSGYGRFGYEGKVENAHRVAYMLEVGPIPDGMEIDHVRARGCTNRHCVNPRHLEAVTHQVNMSRGIAGKLAGERERAKTHCPQGHAYDEANTEVKPNGWRRCRTCHRDKERERHRDKARQRVGV